MRIFLSVLLILACACVTVEAIRFCVWADKYATRQPKPNKDISVPKSSTQIDHSPRTIKKQPQKQQHESQILPDNEQTKPKAIQPRAPTPTQLLPYAELFHKGQEFRSHHPHYLHSFSYPEPVSPHIYFGQMNTINRYVFLVKENETIKNGTLTNDVFYVNGKREQLMEGTKVGNLRGTNQWEGKLLNFAMVIQVQNMLDVQVSTQVKVYNLNQFLLVVCEIYRGYYKVFIVYVSDANTRVIHFSEVPEANLTIEFKNINTHSNRNNFKLAHESQIFRSTPNISLTATSIDSPTPQLFNTFALIAKYDSMRSFRNFKIGIREFPVRDEEVEESMREWTSVQEILEAAKQINIKSFEYKLQIEKSFSQNSDSCEVRAQKQLLQGFSYEFGSLVLKNGSQSLSNLPKELYSFSPSRRRFPWGFLWDDGFHCEVAIRNSDHADLGLKVIKSWLNSMTDFGWIPRQQNRGPERQFLCSCPAYMAKDVRDGNPPTLLLALSFLVRQNVLSRVNFPEQYWAKLQKWYTWFQSTQTVENGSYIYRWYDSIDSQGSFNSGMDDFPRIRPTTGHIDCQSWMYFFAKTMSQIRQKLQYFGGQYENDAKKIKQKLLENFIDSDNIPQDYAMINNQKRFNDNFGYPSTLPIAFGILDQGSEVFEATMQKIKKELDSDHGLTSISMESRRYLESKDAYWKGPVWININYLFLRGLKLNYKSQNAYYQKLRKDLIETVCLEEEERGYFFENYIEGRGSFSYPFTGWTSLISIIVKENF